MQKTLHTLPGHFGHNYSYLVALDWSSVRNDWALMLKREQHRDPRENRKMRIQKTEGKMFCGPFWANESCTIVSSAHASHKCQSSGIVPSTLSKHIMWAEVATAILIQRYNLFGWLQIFRVVYMHMSINPFRISKRANFYLCMSIHLYWHLNAYKHREAHISVQGDNVWV